MTLTLTLTLTALFAASLAYLASKSETPSTCTVESGTPAAAWLATEAELAERARYLF